MKPIEEIPLQLLKAISAFYTTRSEVYEIENESSEYLVLFKSKEFSKFFFRIVNWRMSESILYVKADFCPKSYNSSESVSLELRADNVVYFLGDWVKHISEYCLFKNRFEDPIVKSYEDEYYREFELIDEDADISPVPAKALPFLYEYIEVLETKISEIKTEENNDILEEIEKDTAELKDNLTKKSKAWTLRMLSKIFAKLTKNIPKLGLELRDEFWKQIKEKGVSFVLTKVPEIIKAIGESSY